MRYKDWTLDRRYHNIHRLWVEITSIKSARERTIASYDIFWTLDWSNISLFDIFIAAKAGKYKSRKIFFFWNTEKFREKTHSRRLGKNIWVAYKAESLCAKMIICLLYQKIVWSITFDIFWSNYPYRFKLKLN